MTSVWTALPVTYTAFTTSTFFDGLTHRTGQISNGIVIVTCTDLLLSESSRETTSRTRVDQLIDWCGASSGLLIFDDYRECNPLFYHYTDLSLVRFMAFCNVVEQMCLETSGQLTSNGCIVCVREVRSLRGSSAFHAKTGLVGREGCVSLP